MSGVAAPAPVEVPESGEAPAETTEEAPVEGVVAETPAVERPLPAQPKVAVAAAASGPWRYGYVLSDLKRIGLITTVVALLLVALTFVLR